MSDQLINNDTAPPAPPKRKKPGPKAKPDIAVAFTSKSDFSTFTIRLDPKATATFSRFCENLDNEPRNVIASFLRHYLKEMDAKQVDLDEWYSKARAEKTREVYADLAQLLPEKTEET